MNTGGIFLNKLREKLSAAGNPETALGQQIYMKSTMPYWGVKSPELKRICSSIFKNHPPENNEEYIGAILHIFHNAEKREEWYAAVNYALRFNKYISEVNIDVFLELVCISQWWDIVDSVSQNLIGISLINSTQLKKYLRMWINDDNMWVRRTALLAQLKYRENTNFDLLSELILTVCDEKEFFIRKAIGWALRQYSYTEPERVESFIRENENKLSNLSIREGMKVINRKKTV